MQIHDFSNSLTAILAVGSGDLLGCGIVIGLISGLLLSAIYAIYYKYRKSLPVPRRDGGCNCDACRYEKLPVVTHEQPHCFKTPIDQWPALLWKDRHLVWCIVGSNSLSAPPVFNTLKHKNVEQPNS
jgi:hypothetical protein